VTDYQLAGNDAPGVAAAPRVTERFLLF